MGIGTLNAEITLQHCLGGGPPEARPTVVDGYRVQGAPWRGSKAASSLSVFRGEMAWKTSDGPSVSAFFSPRSLLPYRTGPAAMDPRAPSPGPQAGGLCAEGLIHQMQLERGCSCAWVASSGNLVDFERLVISHRTQTTGLLQKADYARYRSLVHKELMGLRSKADGAVVGASGGSRQATPRELANAFYGVLTGYTDMIAHLLDDVYVEGDQGSFKKGSPDQIAAEAFAWLKEALGIERACVCGILCLPEASLPYLPKRAFADFVLCMEKQRAQKASLRLAAPPRMLNILSAAFELHPELEALQETLLNDFDVIELRRRGLTVQEWWALITTHIDRMHELQTLFNATDVSALTHARTAHVSLAHASRRQMCPCPPH